MIFFFDLVAVNFISLCLGRWSPPLPRMELFFFLPSTLSRTFRMHLTLKGHTLKLRNSCATSPLSVSFFRKELVDVFGICSFLLPAARRTELFSLVILGVDASEHYFFFYHKGPKW